MPQGVQSASINVLGKDREFRASMKTFREVRESTGINMLAPGSQVAITEKLDTFLPALLFAGLRDREGIESADYLADNLSLEDLTVLAPQVFDAIGLGVSEKNEQTETQAGGLRSTSLISGQSAATTFAYPIPNSGI